MATVMVRIFFSLVFLILLFLVLNRFLDREWTLRIQNDTAVDLKVFSVAFDGDTRHLDRPISIPAKMGVLRVAELTSVIGPKNPTTISFDFDERRKASLSCSLVKPRGSGENCAVLVIGITSNRELRCACDYSDDFSGER